MVGDNASIHHVQRVSAKTAGNAARDKRCGDGFTREDSLGSRHFYRWRVSGGCGAYSFVSGLFFFADERIFPTFWRRFIMIIKLGAWLIERPGLGRKLSLVGSTWLTAILCLGFVLVEDPVAVTATTVGISLSSSVRMFFLIGICVNIERVDDRLCGPCYTGTSWVAV
jgi:hypothetical protein